MTHVKESTNNNFATNYFDVTSVLTRNFSSADDKKELVCEIVLDGGYVATTVEEINIIIRKCYVFFHILLYFKLLSENSQSVHKNRKKKSACCKLRKNITELPM